MPFKLEQYLAKKPLDSYPDYIKKEMKIISFFPKELPISYGSFLYRFVKNPGDIDLLQEIDYVDEKTTIDTFIKILKKIINSLDENHIYSEFKCGFDTNYLIEIGDLREGIFYTDKNLIEVLYTKYKQKLFTSDEYYTMIYLLNFLNTLNDSRRFQSAAYDYIYNLIRNKRILRWSAEEILKGYKIISLGRKYTLSEALKDKTIVKIDLIVFLNDQFIEITNLICLTYTDINDEGDEIHIPINVSIDVLHNPQELALDIEKLYYSDKFYSPMKSCKRMYAYMRATRNHYDYLVNNLAPVLTSNAGILYKIKSQIEALIIVLDKKFNKINLNRIHKELQTIKLNFNYVLELSEQTIVNISNRLDHISILNNKESLIEELEDLNKLIKIVVNALTITKMNEFNFNPPPKEFIVQPPRYDHSIIRRPNDNPPKEYNEFVEEIESKALMFNKKNLVA